MPDYQYKEFKSKFKAFKGIRGYKNITRDGDPKYKALYYCKSIVQEDERIVLRWDGKNAREYFIVNPDQLGILVINNFHLFETLFDKCDGKPAFDIDGIPDGSKTFTEHIEESKKIILTMFPNANFQISGSETPTKYSYHIVLSNYKYTDYKRYIIRMKEFALCYPTFDYSIYSSIRYMKCINQSKGYKKDRSPDDRKQLWIEGSQEPSKHLITCDFDEDCYSFEDLDFTDYLVVKDEIPEKRLERIERRKLGIDISNIIPVNTFLPIEFSYFNATPLMKFKVLPAEHKLHHDIIMKVMWWSKFNKISFEDFWDWNASKDNSEARKQRYKTYWDGKQYHVDNKFLDNLLELYYPKLKSKFPLHRYKRYVSGIDSLVHKTIPLKTYISVDGISTCKTNILAVGCGVGKTKTAIDYVSTNPMQRVLVIVPRITLAYDVCERFKQAGIDIANYKDGVFDASKQLITASSLHRLSLEYDTIICDEFETLIDQFLSPTIHGQNGFYLFQNWNKFKDLLIKADKVILLDAITTLKTINFVNTLNIGPYNLIDNEKAFTRSVVRLTKEKNEFPIDTERRFFNLITNDLKNGLKCLVFVPHKTGRKEHTENSAQCIRGVLPLTQYICDKLDFVENKDIVGYYAENYEAKMKLKQVNAVWNELKCVITNTTNSVGINYELNDFDKIYLYYSDFVNPRDVIQVSKRLRNVKNNEMIMYCEPSKKALMQDNIFVASDCPVFTQLKKDVLLERECYSRDSLEYLFQRNEVEVKGEHVIVGDLPMLIKFEESDDYCIRYKDLRNLTQSEYTNLVKEFEGGRINYYQKLEVEKYLFKLDNNHQHNNETIFEDMWRYRFYIEKFDTLSDPNHIFNEFLSVNNINIFDDSFREFPINGCVPKTFQLKHPNFLKEFSFKRIEKNNGQDTYAKLISSFFGCASFQKDKDNTRLRVGGKLRFVYHTDDAFLEALNNFKKHNVNYNSGRNVQKNLCYL